MINATSDNKLLNICTLVDTGMRSTRIRRAIWGRPQRSMVTSGVQLGRQWQQW